MRFSAVRHRPNRRRPNCHLPGIVDSGSPGGHFPGDMCAIPSYRLHAARTGSRVQPPRTKDVSVPGEGDRTRTCTLYEGAAARRDRIARRSETPADLPNHKREQRSTDQSPSLSLREPLGPYARPVKDQAPKATLRDPMKAGRDRADCNKSRNPCVDQGPELLLTLAFILVTSTTDRTFPLSFRDYRR